MTSIRGFTSDTHYGHKEVLGYCDRPFKDIQEMEEALVANYNAVVPQGAMVVWAGDAFIRSTVEESQVILNRLNGFKLLVRGNHDGTHSKCTRRGFDVVTDEMHLWIGTRKVRVSHYPYKGSSRRNGVIDTRYGHLRPPRAKGEVLIHGHTHNKKRRDGNMIHVGVDAWDYSPVSMAQVEALVAEV